MKVDWETAATALYLAIPWDILEDEPCEHDDPCDPDDPECEPCELRKAGRLYQQAESASTATEGKSDDQ